MLGKTRDNDLDIKTVLIIKFIKNGISCQLTDIFCLGALKNHA